MITKNNVERKYFCSQIDYIYIFFFFFARILFSTWVIKTVTVRLVPKHPLYKEWFKFDNLSPARIPAAVLTALFAILEWIVINS